MLPEIIGSLYFEEELYEVRGLKWVFYGVTGYLVGCSFVDGFWLGLGGVIGVGLIGLSVRIGRVVLFMEYISKAIMLVIALCLHVYYSASTE